MKNTVKTMAVVLAAVLGLGAMTACGGSQSSSTASSAASSTASASSDITKIAFGTNAEFAPFEYVSANGVIGEYDGIDMAIANAIGEELGVEVTMDNMEFDSLLVSLQNKQIDAVIAGMTVTEERQKTVDFSTPYYTATQVMVVKEDSDITSAADMEGKNIAVVQGYTGETVVQDLGFEYTAFKKGTECVLDLVNGKSDVVVIDSAVAQKYVNDNEGLKIVEDADTFGGEEYAIAVNKDNPELLEKINAAIEKLLEDGTIAEISDNYISDLEG